MLTARLATVVDLPSPWFALVQPTTLSFSALHFENSAVRRLRKTSASRDLGRWTEHSVAATGLDSRRFLLFNVRLGNWERTGTPSASATSPGLRNERSCNSANEAITPP